MKKLIPLAACMLATGPALAGSITPAPSDPVVAAPAPVYTASNDWTGGYVGAQLGFGSFEAPGVALSGDGFLGGVHGGYNYDFGNYVVGGELSYDTADISMGAGTVSDAVRLKLRAGVDLGNTLIYGTAGASRINANLGGGSAWDTGYFVGAGMEYMMTDSVSVGGEVLYDQIDNFAGSGSDLRGPSIAARVSFHF